MNHLIIVGMQIRDLCFRRKVRQDRLDLYAEIATKLLQLRLGGQ